MQRNLIIDSNNLLHRVFWVCEKYGSMSVPKMFFSCVRNYMEEHMISKGCVYMAWDAKLIRGSTNHRKSDDTVEYKSTRDHERNAKVYEMDTQIRKMAKHAGLYNIYPGVLEADDVIAFLSKELEGHSTIVSVDQDLLQLISDTTDVYEPIKKRLITCDNFTTYHPVPLSKFVQYKAMMGDKSDNIPGIPKVGPKRAAKLLEEGIDTLSSEHTEIYERNLELMDLAYSLSRYPNEVKLYSQQLEKSQQGHHVDTSKFLNVCSDVDCTDINIGFLEPFTYNNSIVNITSILS